MKLVPAVPQGGGYDSDGWDAIHATWVPSGWMGAPPRLDHLP